MILVSYTADNGANMELYVHIPFCVRKCDYCDFLSFPGFGCGADEKHRSLSCRYIDALCSELEAAFSGLRETGIKCDTCFIGGGTPSVLEKEETEKLLKTISEGISPLEFTIECNPGTLTKEKLEIFKGYGVNRLSIGLQSADNGILKALGRIHTFEQFLESYRLARSMGFENINIDLISAVPGQTIDNWKDTLKKVTDLEPEHISAYSLILEEGTPLYKKYEESPLSLALPGEDEEREIYHYTGEYLGSKGYYRYEISNYAKKGYECRHNIGYWTGEEYIGTGLGAASYLSHENAVKLKNIPAESGTDKNMFRIKNTQSIEEYISHPSCDTEEILDLNDLMAEYCILGLRMTKGISITGFREKYGTDIMDRFGTILEKYMQLGLLEQKDGHIRFTDKGLDVSNTVLCDFL